MRPRTAVLVLLLEMMQLLVFVLNARFPWGTSVSTFLAQLRNLQLQYPITALGYDVFASCFWILSTLILACIAICFYVVRGGGRAAGVRSCPERAGWRAAPAAPHAPPPCPPRRPILRRTPSARTASRSSGPSFSCATSLACW